ncbi:MAG TPA: pentapeptide repeat-containing protein [Ktedonobacteraceae bacterium]|nr:pentapeptide repeat-containing protein [Ktedonobacteraceae bacterium]
MQDHPSSSMLPFSHPHDPEAWQAYWKEQGQSWRSEPLIDEERQQRLLSYSRGEVDIERGRYPFKGVQLSRADVEWLLAMEEQRSAKARTGGGTDGEQQKSLGLDMRGADLSGLNLSHLPMMRLRAGLSLVEGRHATVEQSRAAAANLAKADLSQAQLQGAQLSWATLDEVVLVEAHLEGADLGKATLKQAILAGTHLEGGDLMKAHLEGATLLEAHLEGAHLQGAFLEGANMLEAHLEGARLGGAHLEGTTLLGTHFEGKTLSGDERKRLRAWMPHFPEVLSAGDLRGVFLNNRTNLGEIHPGNDQYGYIALADVHWDDVNLTVVDWTRLKHLGDETIARPGGLRRMKVRNPVSGGCPPALNERSICC